jgi:homocysteine S-methyltransferase
MSNALEARGHDLSDALWSARLLRDDPAEIAAVHRSYFAAGATVATTASYQASVRGFESYGVPRAEAGRLIGDSVRIARTVRDELAGDGVSRLVAASIGPYGAVLADGSEYRGRYGLTAAELRDFHRPRLELLLAAGPDLLAVETIPDVAEAEVLVDLLAEYGVPAWLSYTIAAGRTRAGQPLAEAFAVVTGIDQIIATGINCCAPADVLPAVRTAARVTGLPAVAYPNSGETWDPAARAWAGGASYDVGLVPAWIDAGARLIVGCCRVGPDAIAELAATLRV